MTNFDDLTLAEQQAWRHKARKCMAALKRKYKGSCVSLRYHGPNEAIAQVMYEYGDKPIVLGVIDLTTKRDR